MIYNSNVFVLPYSIVREASLAQGLKYRSSQVNRRS